MLETDQLEQLQKLISTKEYKDLFRYSDYILRVKYGWNNQDKSLPAGYEAEDFVQDAISSLVIGNRTWDSEKFPNLVVVLKGMIKSEIYNFFSTRKKEIETLKNNSSCIGNEDGQQIEIKDNTSFLADKQLELNEMANLIYDSVKDDEELEEIVYCLMSNITKRQDIAHELSISPSEVDNRKKRLFRKTKDIKIEI